MCIRGARSHYKLFARVLEGGDTADNEGDVVFDDSVEQDIVSTARVTQAGVTHMQIKSWLSSQVRSDVPNSLTRALSATTLEMTPLLNLR